MNLRIRRFRICIKKLFLFFGRKVCSAPKGGDRNLVAGFKLKLKWTKHSNVQIELEHFVLLNHFQLYLPQAIIYESLPLMFGRVEFNLTVVCKHLKQNPLNCFAKNDTCVSQKKRNFILRVYFFLANLKEDETLDTERKKSPFCSDLSTCSCHQFPL